MTDETPSDNSSMNMTMTVCSCGTLLASPLQFHATNANQVLSANRLILVNGETFHALKILDAGE